MTGWVSREQMGVLAVVGHGSNEHASSHSVTLLPFSCFHHMSDKHGNRSETLSLLLLGTRPEMVAEPTMQLQDEWHVQNPVDRISCSLAKSPTEYRLS